MLIVVSEWQGTKRWPFRIKKDNDQVINLGRAAWAPVYLNPNVRFQINQIGDFKAFCALAYCNIHGLWGNVLTV